MKKYKVIYHIGDAIDVKTKVDFGFIVFENKELKLVSKIGDSIRRLADISQISLFMMNGLGSMLKIVVDDSTIFLSVVRFCIAGKFVMGNAIGTRNLKTLLESCNSISQI